MTDGVASDGAVLPGALLAGRYRVVDPIGSGGMARVFRARDEALGRPVAVKVLRPELTDSTASDRAAIETRLLASLNHPGLVTLFDAHLNDEPRFLVMEHVVGTTLSQRIAAGVLDDRELAALGSQLADALHVVHDAGIVHRDVKPSNILLARSTVPGVPLRAKLADFGIAHLLDSERVTSPSLLIGTAAYIAPELLHGADPAPPSDIYALGLVLLEAATGERAFSGSDGNRGQLLARLSRDPDMPLMLDHTWRDLLCAMTSRRPDDRPTAVEVMARLSRRESAASDGSTSATARSAPTAGRAFEGNASRAAQADVATAAWPITEARGVDTSTTLDAPVAATAALRARGTRPEPGDERTFEALPLRAVGRSATTRRTTAGRRRKRTAIAVGAASIAAIGVALAAHLLLLPPPASPTTDVTVPAVVETPEGTTPAGEDADELEVEEPTDESTTGVETVGTTGSVGDDGTRAVDDSPSERAPADTAPTGTAPTGNTLTDSLPIDSVPIEVTTVDVPAVPAQSNGSAPGSNSGSGNSNGNGSNNGNGPGSNNGQGSGSTGAGKPAR
ncbi:serine/threonine-protein kinase [Microbacterium sp. 2P01SA-2]|uniref:serine/threonine-protein kinase n=1 Tax=unclassified Microbacterium TaxID=2609290 RepID=UPI00399F2549